jgi:Uma2 family endonuclease
MTTVLKKIGPEDHGRPMAYDYFAHAPWEEGYQYELIDGKLYVSPVPNAPQGFVERWIDRKLQRYADEHPEVINYVHPRARVFVPDRPGVTCPEPDVTAYRDYPLGLPLAELRWQETSPVLVVEVLSLDDPNKDLVRNVDLYLQVPTIREYWILDTRASVDRPRMTAYRRRGRRWQRPIAIVYGETYTTRLLPGFELLLDPRR